MYSTGRESKLNKLALGVSTALLVSACGGGGSSSGGGDNSRTGESLTEEQEAFLEFAGQDGLWRFSFNGKVFATESQVVEGYTIVAEVEANIAGSAMFTTVLNGDNSYTEDVCSLETPETYDIDDLDFDDYSISEECGSTPQVTQVSDTAFRLSQSCSNGTETELLVELISSTPTFNHGSLSLDFAADSYDDLNTSNGICGSQFDTDYYTTVTITPTPPFPVEDSSDDYWDVQILAPYGSTKVELYISMAGSPAVGVHTVGDDPGEAAFEIASTAFSGGGIYPEYIEAESGNVSITSVSEFAVSGTFDVTLPNGDTVTGAFSLDIN